MNFLYSFFTTGLFVGGGIFGFKAAVKHKTAEQPFHTVSYDSSGDIGGLIQKPQNQKSSKDENSKISIVEKDGAYYWKYSDVKDIDIEAIKALGREIKIIYSRDSKDELKMLSKGEKEFEDVLKTLIG